MKKLREITLLCHHTLSSRSHYSLFRIAPFLKGQALTVASTLRRILLTEIGTIHATSLIVQKPTNVLHEFSLVSGFKESFPEILSNLREIVFRVSDDSFLNEKNENETETVLSLTNYARLSSKGKGFVTAQDILFLPTNKTKNIHVVDTKQHIATAVSPHAVLEIDLELRYSKQYLTCVEQSFPSEKNSKIIHPLNSSFSPVNRVNYFIKQNPSLTYEFILLEIWTDGSITPAEALGHSSIATKQLFQPFV